MAIIYFTPEQLPYNPRIKSSKLQGRKFGALIPLKVIGRYCYPSNPKKNSLLWLCQCDCGNTYEVQARNLLHDAVTSCGCTREWHGRSSSKIYKCYLAIKQRCFNPRCAAYNNYGARGITMHDSWVSSFEQFSKDVGEPPSHKHSLDRINNNGHYEPGNVRWATSKQQANNKRTSHYLTINGVRQTITRWAEETNKSPLTITTRLNLGWTEEAAVFTPVRVCKPRYQLHPPNP